jgi:hypothetical protein
LEEALLERSTFHYDVIRKIKPPLKRATGDTEHLFDVQIPMLFL